MAELVSKVSVKTNELAETFLTFWSQGGFQGVPGAAGSCWELPGASEAEFRARKIESGLNRHLRQQLAAISGWIFSPGSPGASGHAPRPKTAEKQIKTSFLGPGPPWAPHVLVELRPVSASQQIATYQPSQRNAVSHQGRAQSSNKRTLRFAQSRSAAGPRGAPRGPMGPIGSLAPLPPRGSGAIFWKTRILASRRPGGGPPLCV